MRFLLRPICILFYRTDYKRIKKELQFHFNVDSFENEMQHLNILIDVLIVAEDHRFKWHIGFDVLAILRACKNNIIYGKREGASTIEQQLVRVLTNNYEIKLKRKLKEILLATTLTAAIPRKYIPLYYLKVAYFGITNYGYNNLCKYLCYDSSNLSIQEAAAVIARLKYPETGRSDMQKKINERVLYLINKYEKN